MAIKMTVCAICHKEATKASTLSLKELGGGEGRACRSHDEVKALVEKHRQAFDNSIAQENMEEGLAVITAVSAIRVYHTIHGMPLELIYSRLARAHSPATMEKIKKEVERLGPNMSVQEIQESIIVAAAFRKT